MVIIWILGLENVKYKIANYAIIIYINVQLVKKVFIQKPIHNVQHGKNYFKFFFFKLLKRNLKYLKNIVFKIVLNALIQNLVMYVKQVLELKRVIKFLVKFVVLVFVQNVNLMLIVVVNVQKVIPYLIVINAEIIAYIVQMVIINK